MVKCDKGSVEISGAKNEVMTKTAVLLKSLRENISEEEFEEVIENSKKTCDDIKAEIEKIKKRIIAELFGEEPSEEGE